MSERAAVRLAYGAAGASLALLAGGLALSTSLDDGWLIPISASFAVVGALTASRRRENPIGWLFLGFGVAAAIDFAAFQYAHHALVDRPGSLPGGDLAASIAAHYWHPGFGLFVFSFLLFPNGHLLSPRWRWAARATVFVYGGLALSGIFESDLMEAGDWDLPNKPLFHGPVADIAAVVFGLLLFANLALLVVAGVCLVLRLRRSKGEERQQVKVFASTVAFVMFFFPVSLFGLGQAYGVMLFPLIPASAAVAILKYRLWDIDVVINRTLVYGALTATLAATYLASVLLLELLLSPSSDLVVAASTLAVAGLFRPARSRIQAAVDRRFYRRKYDAQRTLESFTARLRDEVALDALSMELRGVVAEIMQPAHVSLWIRPR